MNTLFDFGSKGEEKAIASAERLAASLGKVKRAYGEGRREVGDFKKVLNGFNMATGGMVSGYLGGSIASLGTFSGEDRKQRGPMGQAGAEVGSLAGITVGGQVAGSVASSVVAGLAKRAAGSLIGRGIGAVAGSVIPIVGTIAGQIVGEQLGGIIGDGVGNVAANVFGIESMRKQLTATSLDKAANTDFVNGKALDKLMNENFEFWSMESGASQRERNWYLMKDLAGKRTSELRKRMKDSDEVLRMLLRV